MSNVWKVTIILGTLILLALIRLREPEYRKETIVQAELVSMPEEKPVQKPKVEKEQLKKEEPKTEKKTPKIEEKKQPVIKKEQPKKIVKLEKTPSRKAAPPVEKPKITIPEARRKQLVEEVLRKYGVEKESEPKPANMHGIVPLSQIRAKKILTAEEGMRLVEEMGEKVKLTLEYAVGGEQRGYARIIDFRELSSHECVIVLRGLQGYIKIDREVHEHATQNVIFNVPLDPNPLVGAYIFSAEQYNALLENSVTRCYKTASDYKISKKEQSILSFRSDYLARKILSVEEDEIRRRNISQDNIAAIFFKFVLSSDEFTGFRWKISARVTNIVIKKRSYVRERNTFLANC